VVVPEATADLDHGAPGREDDIRLAGQVPSVDPVTVAHRVEHAPHYQLRLRVCASVSHHVASAAFTRAFEGWSGHGIKVSMNSFPDNPARERRWLVLAETGDHYWLGRATDPSEDEIDAAEASLRRVGIGGFLAISEGDYWSRDPLTLLEVRRLNGPGASFDAAVVAFLAKRRMAVENAS
jgi:hypothetical protein